jgi:hypothetical protein
MNRLGGWNSERLKLHDQFLRTTYENENSKKDIPYFWNLEYVKP